MRHGSALPVLTTTVLSEWVDYNGHMNDAAYAIVFSRSVDALMDRIGLDAKARERTGQTLYTMQMMLHYFKEAKTGDALAVSCHLLEHDNKRVRVWLEMTSARRRAACRLGAIAAVGRPRRKRPARRLVELRDAGRARGARSGAERHAAPAAGGRRRGAEAEDVTAPPQRLPQVRPFGRTIFLRDESPKGAVQPVFTLCLGAPRRRPWARSRDDGAEPPTSNCPRAHATEPNRF